MLRAIAAVPELPLGAGEPGRDTCGGVSALSPGQWLELRAQAGTVGGGHLGCKEPVCRPGELVPWRRLRGRSEAGLLPVWVTGRRAAAASDALALTLPTPAALGCLWPPVPSLLLLNLGAPSSPLCLLVGHLVSS